MAQDVALPLELEEELPERGSRWRRIATTARRHPLGVFGLICVSLLFFCGIFADLIMPHDPLDFLRETKTFGALAQPIDETDKQLEVSNSTIQPGTFFDIGTERMTAIRIISEFNGTAT